MIFPFITLQSLSLGLTINDVSNLAGFTIGSYIITNMALGIESTVIQYHSFI